MRTAKVTHKGISPFQFNAPVRPEEISGETKDQQEERTWRDKAHTDEDGNVFIPPTAFRNALQNAAKYLSMPIKGKGKRTYTKHFKSGIITGSDPLYVGVKKDAIKGQWLFVPSDGKAGGGSRVYKCFPILHAWEVDVIYYILDETISEEVFEKHLEIAGQFIGVGSWRPQNGGMNGRFEVKGVEWSNGNM